MENKTKFCKHCGEIIDFDCVVCPKCGKQVEALAGKDTPIIINNSSASSASSSASSSVGQKYKKLPWYLSGFWIFTIGIFTGGAYWIIGFILRVNWKSQN